MQTTMTVRTDAQLKAKFTQLCEEFGMSANTAMNIFMRAVAETNSIPFIIGKRKDAEADNLNNLLELNRQNLVTMGEPEMTQDEINAEIAVARTERKARLTNEAVKL